MVPCLTLSENIGHLDKQTKQMQREKKNRNSRSTYHFNSRVTLPPDGTALPLTPHFLAEKKTKQKFNTALVYTLFSFLLLIAVAMEITHKAQSFTIFFQGVVTKYKNGILLYTVLFALTHSVRERRQGAL